MHPQAEQLATAFKANFFAADRAIRWTHAEHECGLWLSSRTLLVGRIDALGVTADNQPFFAEWKTISSNRARNMEQVKAEWRFDPQALTYGVLIENARTFTVRWAVKSQPPAFDFEWYTYTKEEIEWWRDELLDIAQTIRRRRRVISAVDDRADNWPTNLTACMRYGYKWRCPLYDYGCSKLNFAHTPEGMKPRTESHLKLENEIIREYGTDDELVVLDASRVEMWLTCQEKYRRFYEGGGLTDSSEALIIGGDFHSLIKRHIEGLMEKNG